MNEVAAFLRDFGYPVFSAVALGYGVFRALKWLAEVILKPLVEAHISFLNTMTRQIQDHGEQLQDIRDSQDGLHHKIDRLGGSNDRRHEEFARGSGGVAETQG